MSTVPRRWSHLVHMALGFLIVIGIFGWGTLTGMGDRSSALVDIPSAIWVVGLLVGGLLISFSPKVLLSTFVAVLNRRRAPIREALATQLMVFTRAYQLAWGAGLVSLLVNSIIMLQNLSDPSRIGSAMAVAMLCPLYGAFLAEFVFAPLRQVLANRAVLYSLDLPVPVGPYRSVVGIVTSVAFGILAIFLLAILSTT